MSPSMACADISLPVRPNRVAVVGASDRPGSLGYSTYHNVRNNSVIPAGAVPVNPRYEAVLGNRAIADVYVAEAPFDCRDRDQSAASRNRHGPDQLRRAGRRRSASLTGVVAGDGGVADPVSWPTQAIRSAVCRPGGFVCNN